MLKVYQSPLHDPRCFSSPHPYTWLSSREDTAQDGPGLPATDTATDKDLGLPFSHLKIEIYSRDYYHLYFIGEETEAKRSVGEFLNIPQLVSGGGRSVGRGEDLILMEFQVPVTDSPVTEGERRGLPLAIK